MNYTKRLPTALRKSLALAYPPTEHTELVLWQLESGCLRAVKPQLDIWYKNNDYHLIFAIMYSEYENSRVINYVVANLPGKPDDTARLVVRLAIEAGNLLALSYCLRDASYPYILEFVWYEVSSLTTRDWSALFWWYIEAVITIKGKNKAKVIPQLVRERTFLYLSIGRLKDEFIDMVLQQIEMAVTWLNSF